MIEKEDINKAVVEFCKDVIKDPLVYFSECDLHFLLSEKLKKNVKDLEIKYPTNYPEGMNYKTQLLHREYGGVGGRKMDICIFSEEQVNEINHWNLTKNTEDGYIKPLFGFELGCEKTEDENHMIEDLEELKDNCSHGYIIHFFKDKRTAKDGTSRRLKTEEKIRVIFKNMVERSYNKLKSEKIEHVKIIAVIIRLFRNQEGNWPQIEIFDKHDAAGWKTFNLKLLEAQLDRFNR